MAGNDFLSSVKLEFENFLTRTDATRSMRAVYPKFTEKALKDLGASSEGTKSKVWAFIFNLMDELKADVFLFQYESMGENEKKYLDVQNQPYVPVLDIHNLQFLEDNLINLAQKPSASVPFIGITYATYPRAYLSYVHLMDNLDKIHEKNKGLLGVGAPRELGRYEEDQDVSAPHYSSFLISDIAAERSYPGGGGGKTAARLFEKGDLAVPVPEKGHPVAEHLDEVSLFNGDRLLQEYFLKFAAGDVNLYNARSHYFSRVHESLLTNNEYKEMRNSVINQELKEYRESKFRINAILTKHGV